jgi:uncharacterized membrane protein YkvA (DUF1232 family)
MIRLSKDQKQIFENNVQNITSKDEQRVLENIDQEIENLVKMLEKQPSNKTEELINNSKLLLELLRCEDFPMTESSRKWIVFGLNYLISDFDLIPDSIPRIGYLDDGLVISWVKNLIDNDITRYTIFKRAKATHKKSGILKRMLQGDGHTEVILIPGFLSSDFYTENFTPWVQSIQQSKLGAEKPGISVLDWKTNYTPEFQKTLLMVDHDLTLKPIYDSAIFAVDWQQLKTDFANLSEVFFNDLANLKKQSPDKKIILISLNIGTYIVDNAEYVNQLSLIDDYYIFGGCSMPEYVIKSIGTKIKNVYNFFNYQDAALKFVFDNFEDPLKPVGLAAIHSKNSRLKNISLGSQQRRHTEYKENLTKLIDSI